MIAPDCENGTKGAFHGAMMMLSAIFVVYNAAAWHARREPHLAVNVGVYIGLFAYEYQQVMLHCRYPMTVQCGREE